MIDTFEMDVEDKASLLENLAQNCDRYQFLREYTQNAIEAIQKSGGKGVIRWGFDENMLDLQGIKQLSVTDNGCGMDGAEIKKWINKLSSSDKELGVEGHYGMGAKISAILYNANGVAYSSWKGGVGTCGILHKDARFKRYGLKAFTGPDGLPRGTFPIDDDLKPRLIEEHGTHVVFWGNEPGEETFVPPEEAPGGTCWLARYLNTRFFRFPDGITVLTIDQDAKSTGEGGSGREARGAKAFLDDLTLEIEGQPARGTVELSGARAWWWVIRKERSTSRTYFNPNGHCAALHRDELYDITRRSDESKARLQTFGIFAAHNQVVIYLEPTIAVQNDIARMHLRRTGTQEPLPWVEWATEFREEKFPELLRKFRDDQLSQDADRDYEDEIKARLNEIKHHFGRRKFIPSESGTVKVAPPDEGDTRTGGTRCGGGGSGKGTRGGPRPGDIYSAFEKENGIKAKTAHEMFPEIKVDWVREEVIGTPNLARYVYEGETCNRLLVNEDNWIYVAFLDSWIRRYDHISNSAPAVTNAVQQWFQMTLMQVVYGSWQLKSLGQSIEEMKRVTTEDALTAAALASRYQIETGVRESLEKQLKKAKPAEPRKGKP